MQNTLDKKDKENEDRLKHPKTKNSLQDSLRREKDSGKGVIGLNEIQVEADYGKKYKKLKNKKSL